MRLALVLSGLWFLAMAAVFAAAAPLGVLVFGLGPPAVVLVIGLAFRWALRPRRQIIEIYPPRRW
jgi:hypothetical protein